LPCKENPGKETVFLRKTGGCPCKSK